ncbi:transposable element Tcb2 transposase [Trichonephila clavipes]|nr:transposable element Tcb2 transposase [Trichonephila clavipes]
MEVAVFSFGEASCLVVVQTFTSSTLRFSQQGPVIVTRFFFHMCVFFRGAMGLHVPFHGRQCTMSSHSSCRTALRSEDIEHMDWPARSPDLQSHRACMGFSKQTLAARTLPPVTIRELRLALQDRWAAMPQQLIDTLILSMGRRCETCLTDQGRSYPLLKTGCFLLDTHHRDVSAFSRIALHATFSIKLLFIPLISLFSKCCLHYTCPYVLGILR